MRNDDLAAAAIAMVGTPFHAQGRLPGIGLDCIGLVACAAKQCGYEPQDRTAYPMRPDGTLKPALDAQLVRIYGALQVGCVLLMAFDGSEPHHVAIYIGNNEIVHAYAQVRKVVRQPYTGYWKQKVVAMYKFPEID